MIDTSRVGAVSIRDKRGRLIRRYAQRRRAAGVPRWQQEMRVGWIIFAIGTLAVLAAQQ